MSLSNFYNFYLVLFSPAWTPSCQTSRTDPIDFKNTTPAASLVRSPHELVNGLSQQAQSTPPKAARAYLDAMLVLPPAASLRRTTRPGCSEGEFLDFLGPHGFYIVAHEAKGYAVDGQKKKTHLGFPLGPVAFATQTALGTRHRISSLAPTQTLCLKKTPPPPKKKP
ncbi:hypothetical protein LX32DRAFT_347328 [Colletotrichum zoysiae]|uniref:Uncharacterized protein n=1 Tax=Colletotrichum zoysiae TaxID=1216348 RepID=A0AAD9H123_9PEZI|nr:hypothetical protein LX32DRAFT_347328 [Colletotrichum zoysiae]